MTTPETPPLRLGWWLSCEEHDPRELVGQCVAAEGCGFPTAMISDHLQPWSRQQGHAPHVWTTLGAALQATDHIEVGTGVTAMVHRSHPIVVAQAVATAAVLGEGRVFLGVGTGERLNEQPFGARWPSPGGRRAPLGEAIQVLRQLWRGGEVDHRGDHWRVEHLQLATRPAVPPRVFVAAGGRRTAALAGEHGDGLIAVAPDRQAVEVFRASGGSGKPCVAQLHVSLAATVDEAREQAWRWWPNGVVPPALLSELARPDQFDDAAEAIGPAAIEQTVVCATDAAPILRAIGRFVAAGFDTVYLHQVGDDQARLRDLAAAELLPELGVTNAAAPRSRR